MNVLAICTDSFNTARSNLRRYLSEKMESVATNFVGYLIAMPAVQRVIVQEFTSRSTPMCRALEEAVESAHRDIDVDDLSGFEREVERLIESAFQEGVHVDTIRDLDDAVETIIEESSTIGSLIADAVKTHLDDDEVLVDRIIHEVATRLSR